MSDLLKGNYNIKIDNIVKEDEKTDSFEEKAINSIGGSMVFVERSRMVWRGEELEKEEEVK